MRAASAAAVLMLLGCGLASEAQARPSTIEDMISLALPRDPWDDSAEQLFESPEAGSFVVLVNRGDVARDVRRFELWLFNRKACQAAATCQPKVIASAEVVDNRPGLHAVRWLDERRLAFIGRDGEGRPQAFTYDLGSGALTQLTRSEPGVRAFDVNAQTGAMVYLEYKRPTPLFATPADRHLGVEADGHPIWSLVADSGDAFPLDNTAVGPTGDLFLVSGGETRRIPAPNVTLAVLPGWLSVSPDGRSVVLMVQDRLSALPHAEHYLSAAYGAGTTNALIPWVYSVDRAPRRLVQTPWPHYGGAGFFWTADGRSVILQVSQPRPGGAPAPTENDENAVTAKVDVETGETQVIASGHADLLRWDAKARVLELALTRGTYSQGGLSQDSPVLYKQTGAGWRALGPRPSAAGLHPKIQEDYRKPPALVMEAPGAAPVRVLDFNPQLAQLDLGEVRNLTVKPVGFAHSVSYGLYLPVGYQPGRRYPLVIQTHGWDSKTFQMSGLASAGYAAQALAGRGFVVVQTSEAPTFTNLKEGPDNLTLFETIVSDLDSQGMIDTNRMGIQAWSRTGVAVRWTLLNSKYRFAAALLVDSMAAGYMEYIISSHDSMRDTVAAINGAKPLGPKGLSQWIRTSPQFNYDRMKAPVKIFAFEKSGVVEAWEDYSVLKRLGKPVEMTYLPDSNHWPLRPSERVTVQGQSLDWWLYWLKGERDTAPGKADQYRRWDELRRLDQAGSGGS